MVTLIIIGQNRYERSVMITQYTFKCDVVIGLRNPSQIPAGINRD